MDEARACVPVPVDSKGFNPSVKLPYGLTTDHIRQAMESFTSFIALVNQALHGKALDRLERILMPANFSSIVGEFVGAAIPRFCPGLARNRYHNGHPDLIPRGVYPDDKIKLASKGIEVKGSRYYSGWQGHNAEDTWLMVFVFESDRPVDKVKGNEPKPFQFRLAVAKVDKSDWKFSERSATSRRTITASITPSGYEKMRRNWIYKATDLKE